MNFMIFIFLHLLELKKDEEQVKIKIMSTLVDTGIRLPIILEHRVSVTKGRKIAFSVKASERNDFGVTLNAIHE